MNLNSRMIYYITVEIMDYSDQVVTFGDRLTGRFSLIGN